MMFRYGLVLFLLWCGLAGCTSDDGLERSMTGRSVDATLLQSARKGNLVGVKAALQRGADINVMSLSKSTPLTNAILSQKQAVIQYLVDQGADLGKGNFDGGPLAAAIKTKNADTVALLLKANIPLVPNQDYEQLDPLLVTAMEGNGEILKLLLSRGLDPAIKNKLGQTIELLAAESNNPSVIEVMLEKGLYRSAFYKGQSPVDLLRAHGHTELANRVVDDIGKRLDKIKGVVRSGFIVKQESNSYAADKQAEITLKKQPFEIMAMLGTNNDLVVNTYYATEEALASGSVEKRLTDLSRFFPPAQLAEDELLLDPNRNQMWGFGPKETVKPTMYFDKKNKIYYTIKKVNLFRHQGLQVKQPAGPIRIHVATVIYVSRLEGFVLDKDSMLIHFE